MTRIRLRMAIALNLPGARSLVRRSLLRIRIHRRIMSRAARVLTRRRPGSSHKAPRCPISVMCQSLLAPPTHGHSFKRSSADLPRREPQAQYGYAKTLKLALRGGESLNERLRTGTWPYSLVRLGPTAGDIVPGLMIKFIVVASYLPYP